MVLREPEVGRGQSETDRKGPGGGAWGRGGANVWEGRSLGRDESLGRVELREGAGPEPPGVGPGPSERTPPAFQPGERVDPDSVWASRTLGGRGPGGR